MTRMERGLRLSAQCLGGGTLWAMLIELNDALTYDLGLGRYAGTVGPMLAAAVLAALALVAVAMLSRGLRFPAALSCVARGVASGMLTLLVTALLLVIISLAEAAFGLIGGWA